MFAQGITSWSTDNVEEAEIQTVAVNSPAQAPVSTTKTMISSTASQDDLKGPIQDVRAASPSHHVLVR